MRVLSVSITERGRALAARLPWGHAHGSLGDTLRTRWGEVDAFICFSAVGAAVRVVAPLVGDKRDDPALLCVDDDGRWVVPVLGGHRARANGLADEVARLLEASAVTTTASDGAGIPPLDRLAGFEAEGDVSEVMRALVDGEMVTMAIDSDLEAWRVAPALAARCSRDLARSGRARTVRVTDRARPLVDGMAVLRPRSLVVGIGTSSGAPVEEIRALLESVLAEHELSTASVESVATVDRKAEEPGILALGLPMRTYTPDRLASLAVPNPSDVVEAAVGTSSVAEAAALTAGGPGSVLVATKRATAHATVAVARRSRPRGSLRLVGLGPGGPEHRTAGVERAVRAAELVVGYGPYVEMARDLLGPDHEVVTAPLGEEVARARRALAAAEAGRRVVLLCSGDAGIYGMASLVCELAGGADCDVEVTPGVTAATSVAALLGGPLGHDFAVISLSDLLTPWEEIEARVRAAAEADLMTVFYNPRSTRRPDHLARATAVLADHRKPGTPVGLVRDAFRSTQRIVLTRLDELDPGEVGMTTTVIVGSTATTVVGGRMVTPRGYTS